MTTLDEDVAEAEAEAFVEAEAPPVDAEAESEAGTQRRRRIDWARLLAFGVLPGLALLLALGAGYLKWLDSSARESELVGVESVHLATDSTIAMLSYKPDTVERDLGAARDRLTGDFKDSYTSLTHDVVIPGSKQKRISAVATVPAAASVSASENHAVVLVFVNQTVIVGADAPTSTASSVRVTLDKIGGRWLVSRFDPV
jgi:Mce-associated membrane protein